MLHEFHDDEYSNPLIEEGDQPRVLIQGKDGNLYGVCNDGGLNDDEVYHNGGGTIFMLTLSGTYTKLYDFDKGDPNTTPGAPVAFLQAGDGNFYGLTNAAAARTRAGRFFPVQRQHEGVDRRCVRSITPTPSASSRRRSCSSPRTATSTAPRPAAAGPIVPMEALGTIFKITTAGTATMLHAFVPDPTI